MVHVLRLECAPIDACSLEILEILASGFSERCGPGEEILLLCCMGLLYSERFPRASVGVVACSWIGTEGAHEIGLL